MATSLCLRNCLDARRPENRHAYRCPLQRIRRALTRPFIRYVLVRQRSKAALARALVEPRDCSRSKT